MVERRISVKKRNLLLSILSCASILQYAPVAAYEKSMNNNAVEIQPYALERWTGSYTGYFGTTRVTLQGEVTMVNNNWNVNVWCSSGNATVKTSFMNASSSTVFGVVQVGIYSYNYSFRVYPV